MSCGTYIGIDPGAKGGIAVLRGESLYLFHPPMTWTKRGKSQKPLTDLPALRRLFLTLRDLQPVVARIEKVWGVRGQSASTGAALAHHRCALESACVWADIPHKLVSPQRWKADLGLYNLEKAAAIDLACKLFPAAAAMFAPVRGVRDKEQCIGFADAALIAYHGRGADAHA